MEAVSKEDLDRIEGKLDLLLSSSVKPTKILLTSKDVLNEYGLSEHILRNARNNEGLNYVVLTGKQIMYKREVLELWLKERTV